MNMDFRFSNMNFAYIFEVSAINVFIRVIPKNSFFVIMHEIGKSKLSSNSFIPINGSVMRTQQNTIIKFQCLAVYWILDLESYILSVKLFLITFFSYVLWQAVILRQHYSSMFLKTINKDVLKIVNASQQMVADFTRRLQWEERSSTEPLNILNLYFRTRQTVVDYRTHYNKHCLRDLNQVQQCLDVDKNPKRVGMEMNENWFVLWQHLLPPAPSAAWSLFPADSQKTAKNIAALRRLPLTDPNYASTAKKKIVARPS